jgi:hypothetical protein
LFLEIILFCFANSFSKSTYSNVKTHNNHRYQLSCIIEIYDNNIRAIKPLRCFQNKNAAINFRRDFSLSNLTVCFLNNVKCLKIIQILIFHGRQNWKQNKPRTDFVENFDNYFSIYLLSLMNYFYGNKTAISAPNLW